MFYIELGTLFVVPESRERTSQNSCASSLDIVNLCNFVVVWSLKISVGCHVLLYLSDPFDLLHVPCDILLFIVELIISEELNELAEF